MAWAVRHGRRVYVRSTRSGDKVRHENFGTGPAAEAAAALDERRRREREANRDAREKRRQEWDETSAPLRKLADGTDLVEGRSPGHECLAPRSPRLPGRRQHTTGPVQLVASQSRHSRCHRPAGRLGTESGIMDASQPPAR